MRAAPEVDCELAGPAADVAAHLLAHLAIPGEASVLARAASTFDPAYVAWARATLPPEAVDPIVRDAALLASSVARDAGSRAHVLQWLLVLHDGADSLRRAASHPIEGLSSGDVASAHALAALTGAADRAEVEIARCAIALAAPAYVEAWPKIVAPILAAARAPLVEALAAVSRAVPAVLGAPVRLCQPLGVHGRAFPGRLLIGVPAGFRDVSPVEVAVRVVHEVAAQTAGEVVDRRVRIAGAVGEGLREGMTARWALAEHLALEATAALLAGTAFATAHDAFSARLDRSALDPRGLSWLEEVVDRMASRER